MVHDSSCGFAHGVFSCKVYQSDSHFWVLTDDKYLELEK